MMLSPEPRYNFSSYPLYVNSNEPLAAEPISSTGDFTLVGCSWLRLVEIAKSLIENEPLLKPEALKVPQLIVADASESVMEAWKRLKRLLEQVENYQDIRKFDGATFFQGLQLPVSLKTDDRIPLDVALKWYVLISIGEITNHGALFQWFKNTVLKAKLFQLDWASENGVAALTGQLSNEKPIVIYASNIIELVIEMAQAQDKELTHNMLRNICSINPQFTIHFFTNDETFNKYQAFRPDTRVIIEGADILQHVRIIKEHLITMLSKNLSDNSKSNAFSTKELIEALPIVNQFEKEKSKASSDKKQQPPKEKKGNSFGFKPGFLNKR